MHKDYNESQSTADRISYELYRSTFAEMNISFTKLGHEECEICEIFNIHCKKTSHKDDGSESNCNECNDWSEHKKNSETAREKYQNDKNLFIELPDTKEVAYFSVDMQKVIMLPRMEGCKTALFTRRIIAFN